MHIYIWIINWAMQVQCNKLSIDFFPSKKKLCLNSLKVKCKFPSLPLIFLSYLLLKNLVCTFLVRSSTRFPFSSASISISNQFWLETSLVQVHKFACKSNNLFHFSQPNHIISHDFCWYCTSFCSFLCIVLTPSEKE